MNRKAIKTALFNLITAQQFDLGAGPVGFTTASTKLKHWNDVPPGQQPAFFLSQGPQMPLAPPAPNGPRAWHFDYIARIYVNTQGDADPADALDPILDAIANAFDPAVIGGAQTLTGLAQWARIEGTIETFEGTLGDQEVALIPLRVLVA
jgi:hypothetical protein